MKKAIGMIEFNTVASGITAADQMVKTSEVDIIEAHVVCPGKYIALICGELSAVNAAISRAEGMHSEHMIGKFVLGNPDEAIFPAIYGTAQAEKVEALGIMETYDVSTIIVAADIAVKTSIVKLIELRVAKGMCGKSYFLITGGVAACEAAIRKVKESIKDSGMYLDSSVIANPDEKIWETII